MANSLGAWANTNSLISPSTHPCHFLLCHPSFCTQHSMPSCGCFSMHHYSDIPTPQTLHWLTVDYVHRFCFISFCFCYSFHLKNLLSLGRKKQVSFFFSPGKSCSPSVK